MEGAALYREDTRDGVPATPLRSLALVLSMLVEAARVDLARGDGLCDAVLLQDPPRDLAGSVAAITAFADALMEQLRIADRFFSDVSAKPRPAAPEPHVRGVVMHLAAAVLTLADVLREWVAAAEAEAAALDSAASAVAQGRAIVRDDRDILVVLPIAAAGGAA